MRIMVNGAPREVAAETLAEALEALGQGGDTVATALNEEFVPAAALAEIGVVKVVNICHFG